MNKVAIIGVNRFIGFHLCDYFLKKGYEVKGYIHEAHKNEQLLQEEMGLFLGRNGNFSAEKLEEAKPLFSGTDQLDAIYFSYFDQGDFADIPFLRKKIVSSHSRLIECISYCLNSNTKLILLSSLRVFGQQQLAVGENIIPVPDHREGRLYLHLEKMVTKFSSEKYPFIIFRVPTVYGPWQPLSAAYQQACIQEITKEHKNITINEDTRDILFVDDIVEVLAQSGEAELTNAVVHLVSHSPFEWKRGADPLNIPYELSEDAPAFLLSDGAAERLLRFSPKVGIREGIQRQKSHTKHLLAYPPFL